MERAEAEAIYDAGRDACVQFMLDLAARVAELEERLRRLEDQAPGLAHEFEAAVAGSAQDAPAAARGGAREGEGVSSREGAQRKAGGQSGHRGAGRELTPEDQVDEIVDHYPDACRGCGHEFTLDERQRGRRFGRRQVAELPPISVIVVEHRTHRLRCRECRVKMTAAVPDAIGASAFGPNLQAAIVTLTVRNRISRRAIAEFARELFGIRLFTGAVDAICQRASQAPAGPHAQLQDWVRDQRVLHVDETGWRTAGDSRALWAATNTRAALFEIAEHCNRAQFDALIGPFSGIIVSDRWPGYEHLDPAQRQVCWSHLQRDFRRHSEGLAEPKTFGEQGLRLTGRVFAAWRAYQHDHHDPHQLKADIEPIQTQLQHLLEHAGRKSARTRHHRRFANNLLKVWPALWNFASHPGVEPTNNPAERALRGPVIHRKLSHGTRSDDGERFAERALSAAATCRLQDRSLFAYLRERVGRWARLPG